jgi:hypothetical protein
MPRPSLASKTAARSGHRLADHRLRARLLGGHLSNPRVTLSDLVAAVARDS